MIALTVPAADPAQELARSIVENGHKKIGVVPMVITRTAKDETTVSSELSPRAVTKSHSLYEKLIAASRAAPD